MIIQYTKLDTALGNIDLTLWLSCVIITFLIALLTLIRYTSIRSVMEKFQKENILTWTIFLLSIAIANTLNIIWRFVIVDTEIAASVDFISRILVHLAILTKIINIERGINHSDFYRGYYFTILYIISIIYGIIISPFITDVGIAQIIYLVISLIGFIVFPGIFLYIALKSSGTARRNALYVVIGAILLGAGLLFQPRNIAEYFVADPNFELIIISFTILSPLAITLGILLIYLSYKGTLK